MTAIDGRRPPVPPGQPPDRPHDRAGVDVWVCTPGGGMERSTVDELAGSLGDTGRVSWVDVTGAGRPAFEALADRLGLTGERSLAPG